MTRLHAFRPVLNDLKGISVMTAIRTRHLPDGMSASLPFGLAVAAREPVPTDPVDLAALVWDDERQIMLVRDGGGLVPWMKHSTGKTNTDSNTDGNGAKETDEDYSED